LPSAALWAFLAEKLFIFANRENLRIFPIGLFTGGAQRRAFPIVPSGRYFSAKNGKKIASFVCFLYNTGKIN
jgi:hypothetical protein